MQESALDIYNAALSAIHSEGRLTSLTQNKKEANECNTWYDIVVRTVQEAAFWPSSRTAEVLTDQIKDSETNKIQPAPDFMYSYRLPYECLRPRYLASYMPFQLFYDYSKDEVRLNTNDPEPVLVFSILQPDVKLWAPSQIMATIYGLAFHIAGPITGRGEIIQKNLTLANQLLLDAQASALNSETFNVEHVPETLRSRGYTTPSYNHAFHYPFGAVFSTATGTVNG